MESMRKSLIYRYVKLHRYLHVGCKKNSSLNLSGQVNIYIYRYKGQNVLKIEYPKNIRQTSKIF